MQEISTNVTSEQAEQAPEATPEVELIQPAAPAPEPIRTGMVDNSGMHYGR